MVEINYVDRNDYEDFGILKIHEYLKNKENIKCAIEKFLNIAENLEPDITKSTLKRSKVNRIGYINNFNYLCTNIGSSIVDWIVVTNLYNIKTIIKNKESIIMRDELNKKYNINSSKDLDLRYCISRNHYICWDSLLTIMYYSRYEF